MNGTPDQSGFNVVIVGGGVAALEASLCLSEVAGRNVSTTIIAPNKDFVCVPVTVQEPFERPLAKRYPLAQIAKDAGAELCSDSFAWLDSEFFVVHTKGGEQYRYDALLLAPGAHAYENFRHTITLDPHRLDEQFHGVLQDIEKGHIQKLAFLIPSGPVWPLPIYELALMTAARAKELSAEIQITIITPERAPLWVFGDVVADRVGQLLASSGVETILSTQAALHRSGVIATHPGEGEVYADCVIALPQLFGPPSPGVPTSALRGFISTDRWGRVNGLRRTYAAGDATDYPVKFGGIAAQQADIAAQSIAALAGVPVEPELFRPKLDAELLTGGAPLRLSAQLVGVTATHSEVTQAVRDSPHTKIAARYLAPYLHGLDQRLHAQATTTPSVNGIRNPRPEPISSAGAGDASTPTVLLHG